MDVRLKVSVGELIDKLTILNIKKSKINNENKLEEVKNEISELEDKRDKVINQSDKAKMLSELEKELKSINENLWDIEERIRELEEEKRFDKEFIELARSVYKNNDRRFELKDKINKFVDSDIKEVKSY